MFGKGKKMQGDIFKVLFICFLLIIIPLIGITFLPLHETNERYSPLLTNLEKDAIQPATLRPSLDKLPGWFIPSYDDGIFFKYYRGTSVEAAFENNTVYYQLQNGNETAIISVLFNMLIHF